MRPGRPAVGFHWLNASANSVVRDAQIESAVAQYEFIAVLSESLETGSRKAYQFDWPFLEAGVFATRSRASSTTCSPV